MLSALGNFIEVQEHDYELDNGNKGKYYRMLFMIGNENVQINLTKVQYEKHLNTKQFKEMTLDCTLKDKGYGRYNLVLIDHETPDNNSKASDNISTPVNIVVSN